MLFLTYLLFALVSVYGKLSSDRYILDITNGRLKGIQLNGDFTPELDLSNMDLTEIEQGAFDNVSDIESLDLSNNTFFLPLPKSLFSNLSKLKNLSLANNDIGEIRHLFIGLENLQQLNISNTLVRDIESGDLFGLTKSVKILTNKNILRSISTAAFLNISLNDNDELSQTKSVESVSAIWYNYILTLPPLDHGVYYWYSIGPILNNSLEDISMYEENREPGNEYVQIKLCKSNGFVTSLKIVSDYDDLTEDCYQMSHNREDNQIQLLEQNIKGFREGWYQLQSLPITRLSLTHNDITEITKETLNNLPENITYVNFGSNPIRKIPSNVIENRYLQALNFDRNLIEEIDEGALRNTQLIDLYLSHNRLKDLKFVATLPDTMINLILNNNSITYISDDLFTNLSHLRRLYIYNNNIEMLKNNSFHGLTSLQRLNLDGNNITTIEPDAFKGLNSLRGLSLAHNHINNLQEGTFAELDVLQELDLSSNKINKVPFADLPKNLPILKLNFNEIDTLENGSFVDSPTQYLSLTGNRISSIKKGAFNLPTLRDLYLEKNSLTVIDGDSYKGLDQLRYLWLNENNITQILNGAGKHLGSIYILDITLNPLEVLENGSFHGINMSKGSILYINNDNMNNYYFNCLKEIHGGIFNNL